MWDKLKYCIVGTILLVYLVVFITDDVECYNEPTKKDIQSCKSNVENRFIPDINKLIDKL